MVTYVIPLNLQRIQDVDMIRKAKLSEIPEILAITKACALKMISNEIYQWNELYPSKEAFAKDIERDELYVLEINNGIIGGVTISTYMDTEYIPVKWLTPNTNNIYVHRLYVHPKEQAKGFAQKLMEYAENYAKSNEATSVRLDTFSQNIRNQKFYEKRGYVKLDDIFFPKQSKHPFHCYELVLKSI